MNRVKADFGTKEEKSLVIIGKSSVLVPEIKWNKKGIKWFDDSRLIRKENK